jgi:hypothetical protein
MNEKMKGISVRRVQFHDDTIEIVEKDEKHYIPMKALSERMGLKWGGQQRRIRHDPILSSVSHMMWITAADGKAYKTLVLPLSYLNGWMFGIDLHRYTGEMREKLMVYQRECYDVLHERFFGAGSRMAAEFRKTLATVRKEADAAIRAALETAEREKRGIDPVLKAAVDAVEARLMFLLQLMERGKGPLNLTESAAEGLKLNLVSIMDEIFATKVPRRVA